jgi:hypothetical protein
MRTLPQGDCQCGHQMVAHTLGARTVRRRCTYQGPAGPCPCLAFAAVAVAPKKTTVAARPHLSRCPVCDATAFRVQRSGPVGSAAGEQGPVVVYPCNCWISAEAAGEAARGRLRLVTAGA